MGKKRTNKTAISCKMSMTSRAAWRFVFSSGGGAVAPTAVVEEDEGIVLPTTCPFACGGFCFCSSIERENGRRVNRGVSSVYLVFFIVMQFTSSSQGEGFV